VVWSGGFVVAFPELLLRKSRSPEQRTKLEGVNWKHFSTDTDGDNNIGIPFEGGATPLLGNFYIRSSITLTTSQPKPEYSPRHRVSLSQTQKKNQEKCSPLANSWSLLGKDPQNLRPKDPPG
jgi:hypothetical protein